MKTFQLTKVGKMGDYDEEWGQVFWCEVAEDLKPVRFQKKLTEIKPGSRIFAEEAVEKPGKKGPYLQLKKVSVEPPAEDDTPAESPRAVAPSPAIPESHIQQILELLKENNEMLKTLTAPGPHFDSGGAPIREDFIPDDNLEEIWRSTDGH